MADDARDDDNVQESRSAREKEHMEGLCSIKKVLLMIIRDIPP